MIFSFVGVVALLSAAPVLSEDYAPEVDLGYVIHQATTNADGDFDDDFYAFKNIRYADPPVGGLRFQHPHPVSSVDRTAINGSFGFHCPQAYPEWVISIAHQQDGGPPAQTDDDLPADPLASEDCLFLDVFVPKPVLANASDAQSQKDDDNFNPAGILARSMEQDDDGVVLVSINYRLGLFGWLNGDGDDSIVPNLGLQDQLLAFDWVTVMGQSAGAGSITHHLTAENGQRPVSFQQAIIQSPGWDAVNAPSVWAVTLAIAGDISGKPITNGKELVDLDYETLSRVNQAIVFASPSGSFTFGPSIDHSYVTEDPASLLYKGNFNKAPKVMVGHNSNEAGLYVSADLDTREELEAVLRLAFQDRDEDFVNHLMTKLYPEPDDTDLYESQFERACLIFSEASFTCHTNTLAKAYRESAWGYRFQAPPGIHAQELPWTFYDGDGGVERPEVAEAMQAYFVRFAQTGDPNMGTGYLAHWEKYGDEAHIATFGLDGIGSGRDDAANERCEFWDKGEYQQM